MLRAEGVTYRVGAATLVERASLRVEAGEVVAMLGRNGAGKSTLLRLLADELRPHEGTIELHDRALHRWRADELARVRAVLPQSESLRFAFTVREVVTLGRLPCVRTSLARETEIVEAALDAVGMYAFLERAYPTLSGGERARVQFARVLAQIWEPTPAGPRLLLLDEPTAGLDLAHQHDLLAVTRRFAADGVAVVAVLHDPNLALAYASRSILLERGRIVADGPSADVLTSEHVEALFDIPVEALSRGDGGPPWLAARPRR